MVCFAETLEMDNLAFPEEANDIIYVRIVRQAENVVIGEAGFLLCGHIFGKIGDDVPSDLHSRGGPGIARGKLGIDASGVVHKVGIKPGGPDLIFAEITGKLMDQSTHHL